MHLSYLEPTEQHVKVGFVWCEAVGAVNEVNFAEPTKEQNQITYFHLLLCHVGMATSAKSLME